MNKFQEALDIVNSSILNCSTCDRYGCKRNSTCSELLEYKNAIATLQELIDHQNDYISFQELKIFYEKKIERLEKALDITIDLIYGKKGSFIIPHNRKAYKEWVLKESENE